MSGRTPLVERPRVTARMLPVAVALAALAAGIAAWGCSGSKDTRPTATTAPASVTDPLPDGPVGHDGRWLTDASGRVLLLHGINMVSKSAPYYPAASGFGEDDAAWLEDNGFDAVRLGVMATALMPEPGKIDTAYLEHLAETVDVLAKHHILVLLDFHQDGWGEIFGGDGFPEWMTLTGDAENTRTEFPLYYVTNPAIQAAFQSFWENRPGPGGVGIRDRFDAMAAALAERFAASPNILGYDFINEPWPGTTWEPCGANAGGCPDLDRAELDPFYTGATAAVRKSDRQHLVFGEPFVLINFGNSTTNIALPGGDANSGLSFHVYPLTEDGVPKVLKNVIAWSERTGGALLETEWGATDDAAIITQQADAFDEALMPWMFWTYDERVIDSMREPPAGANLHASTVGALVRPHPLAVAGTPTKLRYDAATRTMTFTWSTAGPSGRAFPAGSVSSFELPRAVYPDGYSVTADGATVTSASGARMLTVASTAGAAIATITVTPKAAP